MINTALSFLRTLMLLCAILLATLVFSVDLPQSSTGTVKPAEFVDTVYVSPTGTNDDTKYLQDKINNNSKIILKPGTYYIDAITKLLIPSNKIVWFEEGAILQAITNSAKIYTILAITGSNVHLINPVCIGDRLTHTGTTGEWGFGISVGAVDNVKIDNPVCNNCWGDGIYIGGGASNVYINNAICNNNRRQGISITGGINININGAHITNTNGTPPESGIDIEPNFNTAELKGIYLKNVITENCNGIGITCNLSKLYNASTDKFVYINIENHVDIGSNKSFCVYSLQKPTSHILSGEIIYKNSYGKNNRQQGILIYDYAAQNTPKIIIDTPNIVDANTSNQTSAKYGSGIAIIRELLNAGTTVMGNIFIKNPSIIDTRTTSLHKRGIYIIDEKSIECLNVIIDDPLEISGLTMTKELFIDYNSSGIKVKDTFNITALNSTLNTQKIYRRTLSKITNIGAGQLTNFTLVQSNGNQLNDSPITFTNMVSFGLKITPQDGQTILPLSSVAGKYIKTTQIGASITLRQIAVNQYIIDNMVGTWIVEP